jgi:glycosyltransferase involved in cell wall biosynthesis
VPSSEPHVDVWHNILWSRYKARIFAELTRLSAEGGPDLSIFHVAETDGRRRSLGATDFSAHDYPHRCLFAGAYDDVPLRRRIAALARHAWSSRADLTILAGYDRPEYWVQAILLRLRSKKIGVFCDSTILDRRQSLPKTLAKRLFFAMCRCAVVYGSRSRAYVESLGMPSERIFVDCQAAAVPADLTPERVLRLRRTAKRPVPTVLYVGRLSPEKGLDTVLAAFRGVLARRPEARLVLVGDGPQRDELRRSAASLGIAPHVVFAGAREPDALWPHYLEADCLVLASRREPWGLVVNEALSLGCPVVVSDRCGCVPELVVDGVTGHSFPCDDVEALTDRLLAVLASAPGGDRLSEGCLRVIGRYTPTAAAGAIRHAIRVTLDRP